MENKIITSKQIISSREEKIIREFDYGAFDKLPRISKKRLDKIERTEITKPINQKIVVYIKPRTPVIKTLYIAEKKHFISQKNRDSCGSILAIGDHPSFTSQSSDITRFSQNCTCRNKKEEQCSPYTQAHQVTMIFPKIETNKIFQTEPNKLNKGESTTVNPTLENISQSTSTVEDLYKKIYFLEKKLQQQEMVLESISHRLSLSSSDDETSTKNEQNKSPSCGRPGCSYVEYSHVPEASAFQRHSHQPAPLSASKATTIQKEHNSEQYGRNFTLYDNVTARGRRQCASVPCKRNDAPKLAADRVHKIRHKLNPVRDYRLMDTVHYLAQGEFAPRDDGIKLTPSREAVLSDIIWEDVCRTHWPNARLPRRVIHSERCNTRSDLQRLVDNLLRERVAHIERRRRRHYRIVKLNNRHENCRAVGKTGDIIVASHKNKNNSMENVYSDHNSFTLDRERRSNGPRRSNKSNEQLLIKSKHRPHCKQEDCSPGPSYVEPLPTCSKEPTCCYRSNTPTKTKRRSDVKCEVKKINPLPEKSSSSSITCHKIQPRKPRLIIRNNSSWRKYNRSNEPDLEHFILLPTLVVRTPSNMKRQKKFNKLYHRILNVQINNFKGQNNATSKYDKSSNVEKKDIGFNINITPAESKDNLQ